MSENALYWCFVVLSWLPIYAVIYIAPRMLGGLIMWVPGGVAFLLGALTVAWQWLARGPRTSQPHERLPLGAQPRLISGKQTR
nr:cytochrome c oxidase assembly protein [Trinickia dabaoshanensis]